VNAGVVNAGSAEETHELRILPGEVLVLEPQVVHCASNLEDAPCRFLCIEGIGRYDFIA